MNYLNLTLFTLFVCLNSSFAGVEQAPPSFTVKGKKAVWIDFIKAKYDLSFNVKTKESLSVATIIFEVREKGFPIFDIIGKPISISMNNIPVGQQEIQTPGNESRVRIIDKELKPGSYTFKIVSNISNGVIFDKNNVSVGFFNKDMKDRHFLERYIPSNYEYDQYKMEISIRVIGTNQKHRLFTNGSLVDSEENYFYYTYPEYFTSTSLYLHLAPVKKFKVIEYMYQSKIKDGTDFPITIYSKKMLSSRKVKRKVDKVLKELENDYGPWPHPHLVFYGDGKWKGGMEYAGAATSGWFAIGHELQHNYFARAVMPANGNAGWIDEAVASWRDFSILHKFFHFGKYEIGYSSMNLGNQSVYNRKTDKRSYESGRSFMFFLDSLLKEIPGKSLKKFLRIYFENRAYTTIESEDFRKDLENYSGHSFELLFNQYIYGEYGTSKSNNKKGIDFHTPISEEELQEMI